MSAVETSPPLPPGRHVELPGRGSTFIREVWGPPGAPTVVLLHGWTVTADLNWFPSYEPLGQRFHVVALDLRGHGGGIRDRMPFRLEDCADDVAALAGELGITSLIAIGYSLGGPIAMLVARRHPRLVDGVVLCATALEFAGTRQDRLGFMALAALARASRVTPTVARRWLSDQYLTRRGRRFDEWAVEQLQRNDPTAVLEAGAAVGAFDARPWIGSLRCPAAVIMTSDDHVVTTARQEALVAALPDAFVRRLDGDHDVCVADPEQFVPALVSACSEVASRSRAPRDVAAGE